MNFLRTMSVYFIASLLNAAIPFLLLPVFTYYLSPSDFGMLTLVQTFAAFVFPLTIIGIHVYINTMYYHAGGFEKLAPHVSTALLIPMAAVVVLSVFLFVFGNALSSLAGITTPWMFICLLLAFLQVVPLVVLFLLQASQQPGRYGLFQIGFTAINFGLSFIFVAVNHMNWQGRFFGIIIANIIFSGIGLIWLYKRNLTTTHVQFSLFKDAFKFGFFIIPHEIGGLMIQMANRIIINKTVGVTTLGMYAVAVQVGSILSFFGTAFNQAWIPYLFGKLKSNNKKEEANIVKLTYLFMLGFLVLALTMIVGAKIIFRLFIDKKFAAAEPLVFWVALSFAFMGMYFSVVNYIIYQKKTHILAYITLTNGFLSILLTFYGLRQFGILGAVKAQALGSLIFFLSTWVFSAKVYPMPWFRLSSRGNDPTDGPPLDSA